MMRSLDEASACRTLVGAVDYLLSREETTSGTVGVVGFCMGGGFVLSLAAEAGSKVSAAVPFYGLPSGGLDATRVHADVQGHYGAEDTSVPLDAVRAAFADLEQHSAGSAEFFVYDAGHAFLNDENLLGTYDPEQARLAWGRAVDFLRSHLED